MYNGHKNWDYWNVALWIANDEGLYRLAKSIMRENKTKKDAVKALMEHLPSATPDGAKYTHNNVTAALTGL
jgi:hypothetical protein